MNNETLCCDQIHALLLKETGLMKDVEADLYVWKGVKVIDGNTLVDAKGNGDVFSAPMIKDVCDYKSYRLDKILAKLPEWSVKQRYVEEFDSYLIYRTFNGKYIPYVDDLISLMLFSRGQIQLCATAKLLHLLWKEKLI